MTLLSLPPLKTGHESFPLSGSSRCQAPPMAEPVYLSVSISPRDDGCRTSGSSGKFAPRGQFARPAAPGKCCSLAEMRPQASLAARKRIVVNLALGANFSDEPVSRRPQGRAAPRVFLGVPRLYEITGDRQSSACRQTERLIPFVYIYFRLSH